MSKMETLSLWQPWASLIAVGAKQIETRSWPISYRGPLVIHAAKTFEAVHEAKRDLYGDNLNFPKNDPQCFARRMLYAFSESELFSPSFKFSDLPFGALVCVVDLIDCVPTESIIDISDRERAFGNFAPGRYAFKLANVRYFREPVPANGRQGIFKTAPPLHDLVYPSRGLGVVAE